MNYQVTYFNRQKHVVAAKPLAAESMAVAIKQGLTGLSHVNLRQIVKAEVKRWR